MDIFLARKPSLIPFSRSASSLVFTLLRFYMPSLRCKLQPCHQTKIFSFLRLFLHIIREKTFVDTPLKWRTFWLQYCRKNCAIYHYSPFLRIWSGVLFGIQIQTWLLSKHGPFWRSLSWIVVVSVVHLVPNIFTWASILSRCGSTLNDQPRLLLLLLLPPTVHLLYPSINSLDAGCRFLCILPLNASTHSHMAQFYKVCGELKFT